MATTAPKELMLDSNSQVEDCLICKIKEIAVTTL